MKNKIIFTLKDLTVIYNGVCQDIAKYERVRYRFDEMMLQHSEELDEKIKARHIAELSENADYKALIDLKERLENTQFEFSIEDSNE